MAPATAAPKLDIPAESLDFVQALFGDFFERGVRYFFPDAILTVRRGARKVTSSLLFHDATARTLHLEPMGRRYQLKGVKGALTLTEDEFRLVAAIGSVLSAQYRSVFFAAGARVWEI
jgi:hypothetical protein